MEMFILVYICFAVKFNLVLSLSPEDYPTLGSKKAPRLLPKNILKTVFDYQEAQNYTVFLYKQDHGEVYAGGTNFVLRLNTTSFQIIEKHDLNTTGSLECEEDPCQNVITVIEELNDGVFVCGTNGHRPQCWTLPSSPNSSPQSSDGSEISPVLYSQNFLSLAVEGDLYAAAPFDRNGRSLQFRRTAGRRTRVSMYNNWVSEPTFIGSSWVKRENDPDNEKIYVFFREKNSDTNPEADHWISRVARVCKVDEGGSKRFFQNMWTTFIKARLVCGFPEESLYLNRLQDIYVLHDRNWNNTRVYAIFTSNWNSTAVCIYTIGMIEDVFEKSTFKGYNKTIPTPRPGHCIKNSRTIPLATVSVVKDHPEMAGWVHSVHYNTPFYVSSYNYTKITVDQVRGADNSVYNVLLLATDSGKIHKVLEAGPKPVIILETQPLSRSTILSIKLDSKKRKLVVGFPDSIKTMDLQRCEYGSSCQDCVLAQDPYCSWSTDMFQCTASALGNIQNVMTGNPNICPSRDSKLRHRREAQTSPFAHNVSLGVPFYLSCPVDSYHAEYRWKNGHHHSPCLQMRSQCLHLIPNMTQDDYGTYECESQEQGYSKVVTAYLLKAQDIPEPRMEEHSLNNASQPVARPWLTLGLLSAALQLWHL
ncbi:hypothetical protein NQD34_003900 [Periophthalmus magnuspinnatus]|uniref:semaphorin-7A n=1 Tax=Periophthalmus magnuspinnatus TaxID=409849 RepID=UPI0022BC835C|nr:semaphorin-7A [Periophthalmus magnuspinnatus]KAJ0028903.1 hypothetical protein NQD34_003900 [Periophthalmus magnuspinnatus]